MASSSTSLLNPDYKKEIEELKKQISELQEKVNGNSLGMFGRSFSSVGSPNSDFLIKTKGLVKILWGQKFIDLIKDGKINAETQFIFSVKDYSKIGVKDGIYVTGDGSIYLKVGDQDPINLVGEVGNTFVSFLGEQLTDSESKHTALTNIGFLYPSMASVDSTALRNGVIYVESDLKLYLVKDGQLSEFKVSFPNPFTELLILHKNDGNKGSLVIVGQGIENSISFDTLYIYRDNSSIKINISGDDYVEISDEKMQVNTILYTDYIKSVTNNGFRLYMQNGESYLEVDHLSVKGGSDPGGETNGMYFLPQYWLLSNNIISGAELCLQTGELASESVTIDSSKYLLLTPRYVTAYLPQDILYVYRREEVEQETGEYEEATDIDGDGNEITINKPITVETVSYVPMKLKVIQVNGENIVVEAEEELEDASSLIDLILFLIAPQSGRSPIRISSGNIDIVHYEESGDSLTEEIKTRIGDLSAIDPEYDKVEGIYTKFGVVDAFRTRNALFNGSTWAEVPYFSASLNQALLNASDSSSHYNLAIPTIEWVRNYVDSLVKPGYYWSAQMSENKPVDPVYLGTDASGFTVSADQPYLWYTNDGVAFVLKGRYIAPSSSKKYILSTGMSSYTNNSTGATYRYPAGFLCYYKDGATVECGYGISNYANIETVTTEPTLTKLSSLLSSAQSGGVPSLDGYSYVWSIDSGGDMKVVNNWGLEASLGLDTTLEKTILNADWGNQSDRPGYTLYGVDNTGRITNTNVSSSIYKTGYGNVSNWNDDVWRLTFLRLILSDFLWENRHRYNENTGWYLNYDGVANCLGYGGEWTARIGGIQAPTNDIPGSIGYKTASKLSDLSGWTIGYGYSVLFYFKNVLLGERLDITHGLGSLLVGDIVSQQLRYFNVGYESFNVVIKKLTDNTVIEV